MEKKVTFEQALEQHQIALAMFGEDDPRAIQAALVVMLLAPLDLFVELEQMAHSTFH